MFSLFPNYYILSYNYDLVCYHFDYFCHNYDLNGKKGSASHQTNEKFKVLLSLNKKCLLKFYMKSDTTLKCTNKNEKKKTKSNCFSKFWTIFSAKYLNNG